MKLSLITKAVLSTAALLVATTGLATAGHMNNYKGENLKGEACPPPPMLLGGFYVGGQLGVDNYRVRVRFDDTYLSVSHPLAATGVVGGLFLGYGMYFTNFYLGGEVFGNYSGADGSLSVLNTIPTVLPGVLLANTWKVSGEARGSWGVALLPGIKLSDTLLLYLRGGYTWANFKSRLSLNGVEVADSSNNRGGWAAGIGMESLVWDAWSLRAEYNHISFSSRNNHHDDCDTLFPALGNNLRVSAYDNQFMLGAVYHFA